jgi:hypothetical protein
MGKGVLIGAGVLLAAGVALFFHLGGSESDSAVARFQARLVEARAGRAHERLLQGTVRASGATTTTPILRAEGLRFGFAPFELETGEGVLVVDGELRGVSDLVRREQGPPGEVEVAIAPGDLVSVLGPITERNGRRGFFGPLIVVRGTFDEWHALVAKASVASIPDQP